MARPPINEIRTYPRYHVKLQRGYLFDSIMYWDGVSASGYIFIEDIPDEYKKKVTQFYPGVTSWTREYHILTPLETTREELLFYTMRSLIAQGSAK